MASTVAMKREPVRRARDAARNEAAASAARLAHIGTNGLGAQDGDLAFFLKLDPLEQSKIIRDGMEAVVLPRIAREWLDMPVQALLQSLRLPASTINRKIQQGERLSPAEADRAARTLLVYAHARDVLEDGALAARWLTTPHAELQDQRPIDMLDTQTGYDRIRDLLMRLEYAVSV